MLTVFKALAISALAWLIMVSAFLVFGISHGSASPLPEKQGTGDRGTLVALGDSYISGEGAEVFEVGTDVPGVNQCRRAPTAYPRAVADALDLNLVFAACSGAETFNVGFGVDVPETPEATKWPGEPLQRSVLEQDPDARVVLLSIGGNDALFAEIIAYCMGIGESCVALAQDWFDNLTAVMQPRLRSVYAAVRAAAPSAIVYVVGYPTPFDSSLQECPRVGLTSSEVQFLRRFTDRLNGEIFLAAETQGFTVVLPGEEFSRRAVCGDDTAAPALREWHLQWPPTFPQHPMHVVLGSFHPTPAGHALLAQQLVAQLQEDVRELPPPPPIPDGPAGPPPNPSQEAGSPPAPVDPEGPPDVLPPDPPPNLADGIGPSADPEGPPDVLPPDLPPILADGIVPPGLPIDLGDNNPCAPQAKTQSYASLTTSTYLLTGVQPGSTVCMRREFEAWETVKADADGEALLDFGRTPTAGIQGWRSVIMLDSSGTWRSLYLGPAETAPPPELAPWRAWLISPTALALISGTGLLSLGIFAVAWALLRRASQRRS